jgi:hypothetical protein
MPNASQVLYLFAATFASKEAGVGYFGIALGAVICSDQPSEIAGCVHQGVGNRGRHLALHTLGAAIAKRQRPVLGVGLSS